MKTGFVILNYNCWEMTSILAQRVASYKNIDMVVMVDNASSDGSYRYLSKIDHEKIRIIQSQRNGGYSYGNNCGAEVCRQMGAEIIFFANPDVTIEEEQIQKILVQFEKTDHAVLSGVEYGSDGEMAQPPLWKRREYRDDFWDCFFLWRRYGRKKLGIGLKTDVTVQEAEMVKGSFFAMRTKDLVKIGGFDERVFLYCEERILSKKMEWAGMKAGIVTGAGYMHTHSASIQREYRAVGRQIRMLYASRAYYHKNYNDVKGVRYILLLFAMKISVLEYDIRDIIRLKKKEGGRERWRMES